MVHINAVGADAKGKRELSQSVLENIDFVVYDNWEQCSHSGEIQYVPLEKKKQTWASLGEVVSGQINVDGDQTLFDATGLATEDVVTARYIYEKIK
jgi:alanine dehydrogenase